MLKIAILPERSNSNRLEFGDGKGGDGDNNIKLAKKSEKFKSQKLAKFQKSSKLGKSKGEKLKKLSSSGNSYYFNATKANSSFLISNTKITLNRL